MTSLDMSNTFGVLSTDLDTAHLFTDKETEDQELSKSV